MTHQSKFQKAKSNLEVKLSIITREMKLTQTEPYLRESIEEMTQAFNSLLEDYNDTVKKLEG